MVSLFGFPLRFPLHAWLEKEKQHPIRSDGGGGLTKAGYRGTGEGEGLHHAAEGWNAGAGENGEGMGLGRAHAGKNREQIM